MGAVKSPEWVDAELQGETEIYAFSADVLQFDCGNCEFTIIDYDCEHGVLLGLVRVRGEHHPCREWLSPPFRVVFWDQAPITGFFSGIHDQEVENPHQCKTEEDLIFCGFSADQFVHSFICRKNKSYGADTVQN